MQLDNEDTQRSYLNRKSCVTPPDSFICFSSLQCTAGVFGARELGRHLGLSNSGGLGRVDIRRGSRG